MIHWHIFYNIGCTELILMIKVSHDYNYSLNGSSICLKLSLHYLYCIVLYCIVLYCITVQNSTSCRECEAQEKQKITHMQNLASQFTKLYEAIDCLDFSKFVSVTVSGGKLFHNFNADGKKGV